MYAIRAARNVLARPVVAGVRRQAPALVATREMGGGGPPADTFTSTGAVAEKLASLTSPTTMKHTLGKALRETGTEMERTGMSFLGDESFHDHVSFLWCEFGL